MKVHSTRLKRWAVLAATSGLAVTMVGTGAANAAVRAPGRVRVAQGLNPTVVPGATKTSATAPAMPMTVSFILNGRNQSQLVSEVDGGWKGPFLTTSQFAAEYGQTPQYVAELQKYLAKYGITSTADPDNLDVTAEGTAAEFDSALAVLVADYRVPDGKGKVQHVFASAANPSVPSNLGSGILAILGLSNYAPFASQAVRPEAKRIHAPKAGSGVPAGELVPADFVNHYGLASTEAAGALGQGQTIGIVTLASVDPSSVQHFWTKVLGIHTLPDRFTLDNVDGGAGPVSLTAGSDETTLDAEQSGAIAPDAKIIVYQAPNTDYGFVDAFYKAASDNLAGSVSASWGESETAIELSVLDGTESPAYAQAFDEAFLELAAQGQSSFVSAGDQGAFDATGDAGTTNLAVDNPGDSPYTTSSGGTTLPGTQTYPVTDTAGNQIGSESVTIPTERAWSWDYLWPLYHALGFGTEAAAVPAVLAGGGGGYSSLEARPSYQKGVSGVSSFSKINYLTPANVTDTLGIPLPTTLTFNPKPKVTTGYKGSGRAVPDLAFNADPQTGYAVYDPQFVAAYGSDIVDFGGTSFVAPQLNGSTAVLASSLGHRLGFWNPVIYAAAQTPASPFTPLDDNTIYGSGYFSQTNASGDVAKLSGSFNNNNLYYTGTAGTVYNPATGLGYANLGELGSFFASS